MTCIARRIDPSGPTFRSTQVIASRSPLDTFSSCGWMTMSLNPAASRVRRMCPGSAKLKGLSSTAAWTPAAESGKWSNAFSWRERQQVNASAPDGRRMRRKLAKAATGSLKVITPNRENTASTLPAGKSRDWASAWITLTWRSGAVLRLAISRSSGATSTPITRPSVPTRAASWRRVCPAPHPISRTMSPEPRPRASMALSSTFRISRGEAERLDKAFQQAGGNCDGLLRPP